MELPILYEDADIVAVAKPAGVMTHPDGHTKEETVSDWFARRYPDVVHVGETQRLPDGTEIARPGIVHRLDRETSGVLVLAKTPEAHAHLKAAFKNREAKKLYLAFTYGVPKERKGTIEFSIGRSRKDFRLRSAQPKAKGTLREAVTRYEVAGDIGTHALLKVMPETGRTHQIRVHLKAIHHPVVCDSLYAPKQPCDLGFSRLGLHAYSLDIPLPSGEQRTFVAPIPKDLTEAFAKFGDAAYLLEGHNRGEG
ncbi:MAG TPA: RluA family pseudouridine synthase [Candidatus Paceibacterota bacterium]|nr:RluA family pseudouridine synthase [Candidatus Paceibacterota bacterium]